MYSFKSSSAMEEIHRILAVANKHNHIGVIKMPLEHRNHSDSIENKPFEEIHIQKLPYNEEYYY